MPSWGVLKNPLMNQLPQFFDWRGELGRHAYLRKVIQRILILIVVMGFDLGLKALMGIEIDSRSYIAEQSSLISVASLVIFVPIDIRRLNDLGVNLWWLAVIEVLALLPQPAQDSPQFPFYILTVVVPSLLWAAFMLFKPGKEYREFLRQKH